MENKDNLNIAGEKSILNVDNQKELIDYSIKTSMRYSIKILLIILPLITLFVLAILYTMFKFTGIIK